MEALWKQAVYCIVSCALARATVMRPDIVPNRQNSLVFMYTWMQISLFLTEYYHHAVVELISIVGIRTNNRTIFLSLLH